jgi:hypothetical protein
MPTELYGNVDYARVAQAVEEIEGKSKRVRGVVFPDYQTLPPEEKARRDAQIQKLASDCGCNLGAKIAVGLTLVYVGLVFGKVVSLASTPTKNYLLAIPVFLAAAVVGKLIALKRIQGQLRMISDEIRADMLVRALADNSPKANP